MSKRKLAVAGQFYPDNTDELTRYIDHFNSVLEKNNIDVDSSLHPRAIIVPHAGYIYSGFTANIAYKYIPKDIKNIIVIGPSHKYGFDGASIGVYGSYPTPYGELNIAKDINKHLLEEYPFIEFYDEVHSEHSTEVQFPFIKNYCGDKDVAELIYSKVEYTQIADIIDDLLEDKDNFIVISTDLSHFYDLQTAHDLDSVCLKSIEQKDIPMMDEGCEACGMIGVKAMLEVCNKRLLNTKILDYRTSADASHDTQRVVGYVSALVY
jgi:AmmeMemoRadiSam system protein B